MPRTLAVVMIIVAGIGATGLAGASWRGGVRVVAPALATPAAGVAAAVDDRGRLHVLYAEGPPGSGRLVYVSGGRDGFGAPEPLPGRFAGAGAPALVADRDGTIHAAWHGRMGGTVNVYHASRGTGPFGAPVALFDGAGKATSPTLGLDAAGRVHAVFAVRARGGQRLEHRVLEGAVWQAGATIATGGGGENAYAPRLGPGPGGRGLALVWQASLDHLSRVRLVTLDDRGETPSPPEDVTPSPAGMGAYVPDAAAEDDGLRVVWQDTAPGLPNTAAALRRPGRAPATAVDVSRSRDASLEPRVAAAGPGRSYVAWREGPQGNEALYGAVLGGTGDPAPQPISQPRDGARIRAHAVAGAGAGVHVVWVEEGPDLTCRVLWRGLESLQ